ncbi:hypothetical protein FUT69_02570 [Xylella taiwanensis]|nr:SCO family protein [Xylella taiwanensis]NBI36122.1 hypothetical protein [Xylella taiwanensis]QKD99598.1 hypothetical protein PLS229_08665 [Xylella taiwanensis]
MAGQSPSSSMATHAGSTLVCDTQYRLARIRRHSLISHTLQGHETPVFLGFTFYPDVCPITLATLAQAQQQHEPLPEALHPQVLLVSIDPDHDSPVRLNE